MKLLKGVTVSILLFLLCFVAPFNIHADTITNSNVLGINTVLISKDQNYAVTNSWYYLYEHTITLDADYIGTITLDINLNYYTEGSGNTVSTISNKQYFVNGNTIKITQVVTSDSYGNQGPIRSSSYLLKSSNVLKTSTITELQQIIDLLDDIYNSGDQVEGLLNDQLEQLELIVSNTSLANTYLDTISKMHQFNIPFESFTFSFYMLRKQYTLNDIYRINYFNYPLYNLNANDNLFEFYGNKGSNDDFILIFGINKPITNNEQLNSNLGINDGVLTYENRIYAYRENNYRFYIIKISAGQFTSSGQKNIYVKNNSIILPIYANTLSFNNFSTDFALQFGLSNKLLDDLDIIANGTTQSNQQASDLSSGTDSMQQQMNSFTAQEDSYNQQMNNSINAIDFTSPVSQNAGILPAANFVISIFNGLIQNNALSVLILIVCVLIIGKKVIGK